MGMSSPPLPRLLTGAQTLIQNTRNHTFKKKNERKKTRNSGCRDFFLQGAQGEVHQDSDPATGRKQQY